MMGRCGEVVEMANRRKLDVCCLQDTRWKGGSARTFGSCKFFLGWWPRRYSRSGFSGGEKLGIQGVGGGAVKG